MLEIKADVFLVGSGDGVVSLVKDTTLTKATKKPSSRCERSKQVKEPTSQCLKEIQSTKLSGAITSLAKLDEQTYLVACKSGDIFQLHLLTFETALLSTCHTGVINDIVFPKQLDSVFATCGDDGVRIWKAGGGNQLLHIKSSSPGATATCIAFADDGKAVITGWSDGCMRTYTPESGKLIFSVQGVHATGISSVSLLTSGGGSVLGMLTGGTNGQLRSWRVGYGGYGRGIGKPTLLMTLKEHSSAIVGIQTTKDLKECITAGKDGSCIIWDIINLSKIGRRQILRATWSLVSALYHPSECQIITLATDGQLSYWEVVDGKEIRNLTMGKHSTVNGLDVSPDGEYFLTATNSSVVKIWRYKQGTMAKHGMANSGPIKKAIFSPNGVHVAAITEHGSIVLWDA